MDEMDLAQVPFEPRAGVLRCPRALCNYWEALPEAEQAWPKCWEHREVLLWRAS